MQIPDSNKGIITISKEKLATLPAAEYAAGLIVVDSLEKINPAINELKNASVIGFDTETRPSFRKGQTYNVSLIQLSTPECAYLFRTNKIGFPEELFKILEDPNIFKVGVSIHDDFHNLSKIRPLEPKGFVELQDFVKGFRIADNSLSRIYGILFGKRISKGQRLTNWEADTLNEFQRAYAALDAWACIKIYQYLKEGNFNPFTSPYLTFPVSENEDSENKVE